MKPKEFLSQYRRKFKLRELIIILVLLILVLAVVCSMCSSKLSSAPLSMEEKLWSHLDHNEYEEAARIAEGRISENKELAVKIATSGCAGISSNPPGQKGEFKPTSEQLKKCERCAEIANMLSPGAGDYWFESIHDWGEYYQSLPVVAK